MKIGDRVIGRQHPPFIIAEMSGNHNQSLDIALQIVDAAAAAKVDALKIQTFTADTMTLDMDEREFHIGDKDILWAGTSLYKLYQVAYTPWEWHKAIFDRAKEHGILAFSTVFDKTSIDFLEELQVPCYKIASFENTDIPLIRWAASTGKPLIISTGMASEDELEDAVQAARDSGCKELILLKCTSTYPASPENTNILTITDMQKRFGCEVGLSDHTMGFGVTVAGVALGATVIEKHFTLDRSQGGVDSTFSMEPTEMTLLVSEILRAWQALGTVCYGPTPAEMASHRYRRSLYAIKDIKAGSVVTTENIKSIRPGLGLPPKYYDVLLGRKAVMDIKKGTALSWDHFK